MHAFIDRFGDLFISVDFVHVGYDACVDISRPKRVIVGVYGYGAPAYRNDKCSQKNGEDNFFHSAVPFCALRTLSAIAPYE